MTSDLVNLSAVIALIMEEVDTEELSGQSKRAFHHSGWPMWLLFSLLIGLSTALISHESTQGLMGSYQLQITEISRSDRQNLSQLYSTTSTSPFFLSLGMAKCKSPRLLNDLWVEIVICILYLHLYLKTAIRQLKNLVAHLCPVGGSITHIHSGACIQIGRGVHQGFNELMISGAQTKWEIID